MSQNDSNSVAQLESGKITSKRNNVLDLLRGYFLVAILITHFYKFPSIYTYYFGRGEMWVSASPGFVFISGVVIGMISRKRLLNEGLISAVKRIFRRGFKLYVISSILTISYTLISLKIGRWQILNYGIMEANPFEIIWKTLLLQYSYGWADLLLYYSVMLMFVAPLVLFFLSRDKWLVLLLVSAATWLGFYFYPGQQMLTGSYLPVESWQFLFVLAMICGYYKNSIGVIYRKYFYGENKVLVLTAFFLVVIATIALSVADRFFNIFTGETKAVLDKLLIKRELGPGLVLMFLLWFTAFYYLFQRFQDFITKYLGWLYLPFGRNSLLTYTVQSIFLFIQFYLPLYGSYWWNTFTTTVLVLIVWVTVVILLKMREILNARQIQLKSS